MLSVVRSPLWSRFQGFNRKGVPETELPGGNMPFRSNNEGVINKIWELFHCSKRWINISSQLKVLDSLRVCYLRRTSINQSIFIFFFTHEKNRLNKKRTTPVLTFDFCFVWFGFSLSSSFFKQKKKLDTKTCSMMDSIFTRPLLQPQG